MNFHSNQREINAVNGNVMAWLADKQIDKEYEESIRALSPHCEQCGVKEVIVWFPKYKSSLTDGLCEECLNAANDAL